MKIKISNTRNGHIEYSVSGKGKPILFLHGGHSNCNEVLFHKGFDLAKYMLITPSRPGYGNTPLANNITPRRTADLMIALLDHMKLEKVVVYAISAGGLTAIEIAANYPERVEKLILASTVSKKWLDCNDRAYKTAIKLFNPKAERITWKLIRFVSNISPRIIANSFYPQFTKNKPHRLDKRDVNELIATFKHYNSKSGFMSDIEHDVSDEIISKIQCPTLIIHSKNDNSVHIEHAEHANKMITNSVLIILDNEWGHLFWIGSDSNKSIKKTIEFIEQ